MVAGPLLALFVASAICRADVDSERRDAICYARRYSDVARAHCPGVGPLEARCDVAAVAAHFDAEGWRVPRHWGCALPSRFAPGFEPQKSELEGYGRGKPLSVPGRVAPFSWADAQASMARCYGPGAAPRPDRFVYFVSRWPLGNALNAWMHVFLYALATGRQPVLGAGTKPSGCVFFVRPALRARS